MAEPLPFKLERDDETTVAETDRAASALMLALKALSQRAIAAVADLFFLSTMAACFWLFMSIPNPNTYQLVELGLFCSFVLAGNWIVRRK